MDDSRFRPTRQQSMARGLYFGVLAAVLTSAVLVLVVVAAPVLLPPSWVWAVLVVGPPLAGLPAGLLLDRRPVTEVLPGGIRTADAIEPWSRVVDLRAERRGARTVVSVYLDSGGSVQLSAPYSGDLLAADPQFERKVSALAQLWRAHRFGGLPG